MRPVKIFESEISMAMGAIDIIKSELLVKKKLSIAFSGGKTPIKFFRLLAEEDINWNNINIFLVDERWVPLDNPNSNYCILNMFLLKHLTIPEKNIHPINYSPSIEKSREKYEKSLLKYFKGDIIFDLMFLGVGNDGHTASIFEEDEVNFVEDVIVTSSRRHPYRRISLGMNVINGAKRKIFLMGPEKISIIEASFLKNLPVSMVVNPEFLSYKNK